MEQLMGGRGGGGGGGGGYGGPAENAVVSAAKSLTGAAGDWVSIADVKDRLGGRFSAAEKDAAIRNLARGDSYVTGVRVIPVANVKALTQRERDSGVRLGDDLLTAMQVKKRR